MITNPENTHTSPSIGARDAQVERFEPVCNCGTHTPYMSAICEGRYVQRRDFESVRQERDRLRAALESIARFNPSVSPADLGDSTDYSHGEAWGDAYANYVAGLIGDAARAALNQSDAQ